MFYSHEILTSRKYGVATVWLVATLGSKSSLRKINRKAIFDVNIPKACETVSSPEAPMALRLQGSLLYGISRVYFQQCTYILVDAERAQSTMRALRFVKASELDPDAGKAKPEQLVIQDDPAFVPGDIYPMMDLDFSMLESSQASPRTSSLLSGGSQRSSRSSLGMAGTLPGIEIPGSASSAGGFGGFELPGSAARSADRDHRTTFETEEAGFLPDPDFNFDAEGNIIDLGAPATPAAPEHDIPLRLRSDSQMREHVRREHEEGLLTGQQPLAEQMDIDQPLLQDDQIEMPQAKPFPERRESGEEQQEITQETSSEYIDAPQQRRVRGRRTLPADRTLQIRNSELQRWNDEYLDEMTEARRQKASKKAAAQSKKNAAHFVFGSGLGGIGLGIGSSGYTHPLAHLFSGAALLQKFRPPSPSEPAGPRKRRSRSPASDQTSDSETRRKRLHGSEHGSQLGRGEGDELPLPFDSSIELAREALPLLSDTHSSQMPWNISSRPGSRASSAAAGRRSHSRPGSLTTPAPAPAPGSATSFDRRASRLPSISPLVGHHAGGFPEVSPSSAGGVGDTGMLLGLPSGGAEEEGEGGEESALRPFEMVGPAAEGGEERRESQGSAASMDRDSGNFLGFVRRGIEQKVAALREEGVGVGVGVGGGDGAGEVEIGFEELLPPEVHKRDVAAQGFMHVLGLANRGLVSTRQEVGREEGEWWRPIWLGMVPAVSTTAVAAGEG